MILFFGKHGQLASSFQATIPNGFENKCIFVSSHEVSFTKPESIHNYLDKHAPEVIVICSAYTMVDKAEDERELAKQINALAPQEIARWCKQNDRMLVHFSTDYVFAGGGNTPWKEGDAKGPLNWYGETKLMGEEAIQNTFCKHLIFRTSWVYSEYGNNFVKTMLRLGKDKEELRIVSDQVGSPTYAPDIARAVWPWLLKANAGEKLSSSVYHLADSGETNWAEFAEAIFTEARKIGKELKIKAIVKITTAEYPTPALRPMNSRLDQSKIKKEFGIEMPPWEESLRECLKKL